MKNQVTSLEGVRGAAAFVVVLLHAGVSFPTGIQNGYLAVDLFFVLSGFVIFSAYGAALSSGEQIKIFVIRRIGRLWPVHLVTTVLYYIALNVAWLITSGVPAGLPPVAHLAALATMTQGLNLFPTLIGNKVSWSVGDEFYVYLAFTGFCFFLRGRARLAAFAAFVLVGYAIAIAASLVPRDCVRLGACLDLSFNCGWARCLTGFFLGALIAEFRTARAMRIATRRIPQCLVFAAALLLMMYANVRGLAFAAPLVFGVLVASLASDSGPIAKIFQERSFQYLGRISYSLYLGHAVIGPLYVMGAEGATPIVHGVEVVVFIVASVGLAHWLNRFVETPWRERFNAWAETVTRPRDDSSSSAQAT
jgi:peptidoglycan/LPS O-acetylase OafA/YrhL